MARTTPRPVPTATQTLPPFLRHCPPCGETLWAAYHPYRTLTTWDPVLRVPLPIRRCLHAACPQLQRPYRPEADGRLARPKPAVGREVLPLVGTRRSPQPRRRPELPQEWLRRRVAIAPRTGPHLRERSDALVARSGAAPHRLQQIPQVHGRLSLAVDGRQPAGGPAVLWGRRDGLSSAGLLARRLLAARQDDLAARMRAVTETLPVPIVGGVSDGQRAIRCAVAPAWPEGPPPLCHFHDLREAATPRSAADRHAKHAWPKRIRGVRPIERPRAPRTDPEAAVLRGEGRAVRRARTEDGSPPLTASGLKLPARLTAIAPRLAPVAKKGLSPRRSSGDRRSANEAGPRRPPCGRRCGAPPTGAIGRLTSSPMPSTSLGPPGRVACAACWAP
jgi:hypothetical protein